VQKGLQIGHPVQSVRAVLTDGQAHVVDSNEMAFRLASHGAFRAAFPDAKPNILEPVMKVRRVLSRWTPPWGPVSTRASHDSCRPHSADGCRWRSRCRPSSRASPSAC
jgi:hypothetical protein